MRLIGKKTFCLVCLIIQVLLCSVVYSHCQIPCGIYDDPARITEIAEHITTIEKSMVSINELSVKSKPDYNQLVRWVDNKEHHVDAASRIITYYFMAQRLKPADVGSAGYERYITQLKLLHEMLVEFMKARQSTDIGVVKRLRALLREFDNQYFSSNKNK